jgi:hypothetical protein
MRRIKMIIKIKLKDGDTWRIKGFSCVGEMLDRLGNNQHLYIEKCHLYCLEDVCDDFERVIIPYGSIVYYSEHKGD